MFHHISHLEFLFLTYNIKNSESTVMYMDPKVVVTPNTDNYHKSYSHNGNYKMSPCFSQATNSAGAAGVKVGC
jgi:hypothetical protein